MNNVMKYISIIGWRSWKILFIVVILLQEISLMSAFFHQTRIYLPKRNLGSDSFTSINKRTVILRATETPLINENIQADEVRLIIAGTSGESDEMIGIVTLDEALEKASELELDLVCINESTDPPVCKIIDYGKYRYEQEKKKKENMKKQAKSGDVKEIKMSYLIEQHDFDVRIRQIKKFLADGDRVKISVLFKGREMQNTKLGENLLNRVFEPVSSIAVMESPPTMEGKTMLMMIGPKRTK